MARKTKSGKHQLNIAEELKDIFDQYSDELKEQKEKGLTKASKFFISQLESASPIGQTGEFRKSWTMKDKYKGVRYIGNTKVSKQNIPLSNLIEFSKNGHPFIRQTFEVNKSEIVNIIKGEIQNGESKKDR